MLPGQREVNRTREFGGEDGNRLEGIKPTVENGIDVLAGKNSCRFDFKITQVAEDSINGTLLFMLSKFWSDSIGIYIFDLHPIPLCKSPTNPMVCRPEASALKSA